MLEANFELPLAWWEREKEVGIVAIELSCRTNLSSYA